VSYSMFIKPSGNNGGKRTIMMKATDVPSPHIFLDNGVVSAGI